jgi:hypothetical protein
MISSLKKQFAMRFLCIRKGGAKGGFSTRPYMINGFVISVGAGSKPALRAQLCPIIWILLGTARPMPDKIFLLLSNKLYLFNHSRCNQWKHDFMTTHQIVAFSTAQGRAMYYIS